MRLLPVVILSVAWVVVMAQNREGKRKWRFRWSAERPLPPPENSAWRPLWKALWRGIGIKDVSDIVRFRKPAYMGVRTEVAKEGGKVVGLRVVSVVEGSVAQKAGLKKGDIILSADGKSIPPNAASAWFSRVIFSKKPGDTITLKVCRGQDVSEVTLTLEGYPVPVEPREHGEFEQLGFEELSALDSAIRNNGLQDELAEQLQAIYGATIRHFAPIKVGRKVYPNPHFLSEVMFGLRNPTKTPLLAEHLVGRLKLVVNTHRQDFGKLLGRVADMLDCAIQEQVRRRDTDFTLDDFLSAMEEARKKVEEAFSGLSKEERRQFLRAATAVVRRADIDRKLLAKLLPLSYKVNYTALFSAADEVFSLLEPTTIRALIRSAKRQQPPKKKPEGVTGDVLFYGESPLGKVVVGGAGRNFYTGRFALIIDVGGDDIYAYPAATANIIQPVCVLIDAGGDDIYDFGGAGGAAAVGGISVLLDIKGNDHYLGGVVTEGAAIGGVSLLADLSGSDVYSADRFCQGAAIFGIAILADIQTRRPNKDYTHISCDRYSAHTFAQGVGLPRGVGLLLDSWGDDIYISVGSAFNFRNIRRATLSQGFGYGIRPRKSCVGSAGGVGILLDENGDDIYIGNHFCQGSAYWFAMGILYDGGGSDHYVCGRYSEGAGIHMAVGVLLEHEGDDCYSAYLGASQGYGHDLGVGVVVDMEGNDRYGGGRLTQGAGNDGGVGLLLDAHGNDAYYTTKPKSSQPSAREHPYWGCMGLGALVDLAGNDSYSAAGRNNKTTVILGRKGGKKARDRYGVFIDR